MAFWTGTGSLSSGSSSISGIGDAYTHQGTGALSVGTSSVSGSGNKYKTGKRFFGLSGELIDAPLTSYITPYGTTYSEYLFAYRSTGAELYAEDSTLSGSGNVYPWRGTGTLVSPSNQAISGTGFHTVKGSGSVQADDSVIASWAVVHRSGSGSRCSASRCLRCRRGS